MEQQGFTSLQSAGEAGPCISQSSMSLSITSTTGGPVEITVPRGETVDSLRTRISQKLSLQTDRMVLVHKDRLLTAGTLVHQGVRDGSRLTLVPATETGSMSLNGKERTMMDTLASLTETQIDDFLSGHSPLTLSLGTGAHTMCVQLQLSQDAKRMHEDEEPQTGQPTSDSSSSRFFTPQSSSPPSLSTPSPQRSSHRPRTSFSSSKSVPPVSCPSPVLCSRSAHPPPFPHFIYPAPVCSDRPTSSITDPLSPAAASTATEADVNEHLSKQPGAVIESFVKHSPGVFSGTFSGTLAPCRHSDVSRPRRGTAIILQILNDLLRAAYHHQEVLTLPPLHHCVSSDPQVKAEEPCRARNRPPPSQRTGLGGAEGQLLPPPSEENKSLQSKLKRLQLLMHQQRLRRWTRRRSRLHKGNPPYLQRHNCS
ncbi:midnolin-like [Nematolebias whitei]|uniref:midnolin-like n=1 Tax=Nematolebias whitei TaxID=451745 RepID=UPI00189B44C3|nr:midnolin-like [Nematolebias whitei]